MRLISGSDYSSAYPVFYLATIVRNLQFVPLVFIFLASMLPESAYSFCARIEPEPLPLGLPILESTELSEIEGDACHGGWHSRQVDQHWQALIWARSREGTACTIIARKLQEAVFVSA